MDTLFFTKAKRAQNVNDYESWIAGGVVPTLNAMDNNGEAYATVLIVGVDIYNADISDKSFQTIKAGGGITSMPSVLIIDGTRVNDVRVYEDGIVPTVISRYGTGGGNVPMIFSHTQGLDVQASETNSPTLRTGGAGMAVVYEPKSAFEENWAESEVKNALRANASKSSHAVVYPIDDARELEKHQNGTGIGAEGAPAYTLDRQQAPAVVVAPTLSASNNPSRSPQSSEITAQVDAMVRETGVVRRLTPVECERLQGFPDDWTSGQADSNRYKQMGNAVAVPVVEWIISRMVAVDE